MIDALKFWVSVVDEAFGPDINTEDFIRHVQDALKACGFKIRKELWQAVADMRQAQLNARK